VDDKTCQVVKPGACERCPLGPLENAAKADENVPKVAIDIEAAEQGEIFVRYGKTGLPLWNGRDAVAAAGIVLGVELWMAHDEH
jgi:hypothetical protein